MSFFEEQLELRRQNDRDHFEQAMEQIAGAVLGERIAYELGKQEIVGSAIEEILKYYHCKLPKDDLPANITTVEAQLEYRMRPYGISFRSVDLEPGWYHHAAGVMIGTLKEDGSAVALIPNKFSGYEYQDLKTGKKVRINRHTQQALDEEAVCFYQPLPLRSITIKDLLQFMMDQINFSDILFYAGMMALAALVGVLSPLFSKWLFGEVLDSKSVQVLFGLAGFMCCYAVSKFLIDTLKTLVSSRMTVKINVAVEAAVMNRLLNLPVKFYKDYSSGELSQRSSYMNSLCSTLISTIMTVSTSAVFSIVYITEMFTFASGLVLPAVLIIVATVAINTITVLIQVKVTKEMMLRATKTSGMTYATITGISKIKLAGAEKRMFARWAKLYANEASLLYNPPLFLKISSVITTAISLIGTLVIYYVAIKTNVTVADYYAFNTAYAMVMGAFSAVTLIISNIANIKPILNMVEPILKAEPELTDGKKEITSLNGGIEFANVCFTYDEGQPDVLHDLSFKIRPGEYVAIVGQTGCGKSTLIRLLLGFEKPQKGNIYYDREDINKLDLKSLRKLIGTVMQDGKLFMGDVYSNIIISAPQLSMDDAWKAAEAAAIAEDIRKMPMGMHTYISEGQGGISGGQKQRLMIARAIAPNPKILIFDEATSALDNITQKNVTESIDALGCTRIVVAHRLSTIQHADRILYLEKGSIAEEGTYEELIAKDGLFAALVERQRLDR